MNIVFTPTAWEQYTEWQREDKKMVKRINELIKDIDRNGLLTGIGKPEPLKHRKACSRRITDEHRLITIWITSKIWLYTHVNIIMKISTLNGANFFTISKGSHIFISGPALHCLRKVLRSHQYFSFLYCGQLDHNSFCLLSF